MNNIAAIRVLVADDHRMVRVGVRAMLSLSSVGVRCVVEEANTVDEAVAMARAADFDVVLMDYQFPAKGGVAATRLLLRHNPRALVLGLSSYDERSYAERMVQAGAVGYMLKNAEPDVLVTALKTVMNGGRYYSNEIAVKWLGAALAPRSGDRLDRLTSREREVFKQILAGLRDREIAERMFLSKRTVDKHRQNIMAKLGAHSAVELVQTAVSLGMVGGY